MEEQFRLLALATRDSFYDCDLITGVNWVNDEFLRRFGPIDSSPEWWGAHVHPDDFSASFQRIQNACQMPQPFWKTEYRLRAQDGQYIEIQERGFAQRNTDGTIVRLVGALSEMTGHKQNGNGSRDNRYGFRSLVESADEIYCVVDVKRAKVVYLSPSFERITGHSRRALGDLNIALNTIVHPDDRERIVQTHIRKPAIGESLNADCRIFCPDGSIRTFWLRSRLTLDPQGSPYKLIIIATDITERQVLDAELDQYRNRLEALVAERTEELRKRERDAAMFRTLADYSPDAIFFTEADGRIRYANKASHQVFGVPEQSLIGQMFQQFLPAESIALADCIMRGGRSAAGWKGNVRQIRHDGSAFLCSLSAFPLPNSDGQCDHIGFIVRDITEQAEAEQKIRYHANLLDQLSDSVISTDATNRIVSWNKAAESIYGWTAEEATGKDLFELLKVTFLNGVTCSAAKAQILAEGRWTGESIRTHKDGKRIDIDSSIVLIRDNNGKPIGTVGVSRDITRQKQAEEALKRSEADLRGIFDGAPLLFSLINDDMTLRAVNRRAIAEYPALYGTEARTGQSILEIIPPERRAVTQNMFDSAMKGTPAVGEISFMVNDQERIFETGYYPIRNEDGVPVSVCAIAMEITSRKRAEAALRRSEAVLRAVFESTPSAFGLLDADFTILLANKTAKAFAARFFDQHRVEGISLLNLLNNREQSILYGYFQRALSGESLSFEWSTGADETLHYWEARCYPVRMPDGSIASTCIMAEDITPRKQVEVSLRTAIDRERELGRLKSNFVAMASHDFRTPLAIIQNTAINLRDYGDRMHMDEKLARFEKIESQIAHLISLLDDVLLIGKLEAGAMDYHPKTINLDEFITDLLQSFQRVKQQRIVFHRDGPLTPVAIDKTLVQRIFLNLLSNASKYSPEDSVIMVRLVYEVDSVSLTVMDQGPGIATQDQSHIFEPFYRGTETRAVPGSGLGLAITRYAVERHGGTIRFTTQPGTGTTFTVTLPITPKEASQ